MPQVFEYKLQISGPDGERAFPLPLGETSIGRQPGNSLLLESPQVSRSHAKITTTDTECWIEDLASSNGTRINDEKLTPHVPLLLKHGSQIRIGPFNLSVERSEVDLKPPDLQASRQPETPEIQAEPAEAAPLGSPEPVPVSVEALPGESPAHLTKEEPQKARKERRPPPPEPPLPGLPPSPGVSRGDGEMMVPPGLTIHSQHLLKYLPGIYHTDFMSRFLGIFEAILVPIEWTIGNFDLFLDPATTPVEFLTWLANWFEITWDATWSEAQRRQLLQEAHMLYARRGTRWALSRVLEIYLGVKPQIDDTSANLDPFTFQVKLTASPRQIDQKLVEALIDAHKPAHTTYTLEFSKK